jgi:hypothetical protein
VPSRGTPIFDATERTNLDLRINWMENGKEGTPFAP